MSNGAGLAIEEFYENKKKESVPPEAKKTVKLLFEKVGDVCSVDIADGFFKVMGVVVEYSIERKDQTERMEIELEVIGE